MLVLRLSSPVPGLSNGWTTCWQLGQTSATGADHSGNWGRPLRNWGRPLWQLGQTTPQLGQTTLATGADHSAIGADHSGNWATPLHWGRPLWQPRKPGAHMSQEFYPGIKFLLVKISWGMSWPRSSERWGESAQEPRLPRRLPSGCPVSSKICFPKIYRRGYQLSPELSPGVQSLWQTTLARDGGNDGYDFPSSLAIPHTSIYVSHHPPRADTIPQIQHCSRTHTVLTLDVLSGFKMSPSSALTANERYCFELALASLRGFCETIRITFLGWTLASLRGRKQPN